MLLSLKPMELNYCFTCERDASEKWMRTVKKKRDPSPRITTLSGEKHGDQMKTQLLRDLS